MCIDQMENVDSISNRSLSMLRAYADRVFSWKHVSPGIFFLQQLLWTRKREILYLATAIFYHCLSGWCSYHFSFFTAYFRIDYLTNPIIMSFILFLCQLGTFTEHVYTFCIWSTYLFTFETILKAPITTGHIVLLRCHILLISVSKSFYLKSFSNIFKYVLLFVWSCII